MLSVSSSMTSVDLLSNSLGGSFQGYFHLDREFVSDMTGIKAIADMLSVSTSMTSLNLSANKLCGVWGDRGQYGTYDATGIKAIADALSVSSSLNSLK